MDLLDAVLGNPPVMWVVIAVVFALIEAFTMGLTTIWFAGGAVVASIVSLFAQNIWIQLAVFIVASGVLVYFTRPLLVGKLKVGSEKTNADALIGKTAVVTKEIGRLSTGEAKVLGQHWTAITEQDDSIKEGTEVTIVRIEGVKLYVITKGSDPDGTDEKTLD